jgi:hypothetical protein
MTTYQYTLTIGDSEHIALEAALKLMSEHCEAMLAAGEGAPYWAHRQSCNEMLKRLRSTSGRMISTSSFCWPEPKNERE